MHIQLVYKHTVNLLGAATAIKAQRDVALIAAEVGAELSADKGSGYSNLTPDAPELDPSDDDNNNTDDLEKLLKDPANQAADEWDENKHSRKDNGQFGAGGRNEVASSKKGKSSSSLKVKGDELGSYSSTEELRKKAVDYYKQNLQGKKVSNADLEDIMFSRVGLSKYKSTSANPDKLKMIVALEDIIKNGKYSGEIKSKKENSKFVKFHRINHTVELEGKEHETSVLIGEDADGKKFYNLNPDAEDYPINNEAPTVTARQSRAAGTSIDSIDEKEEFVNLFFN